MSVLLCGKAGAGKAAVVKCAAAVLGCVCVISLYVWCICVYMCGVFVAAVVKCVAAVLGCVCVISLFVWCICVYMCGVFVRMLTGQSCVYVEGVCLWVL